MKAKLSYIFYFLTIQISFVLAIFILLNLYFFRVSHDGFPRRVSVSARPLNTPYT